MFHDDRDLFAHGLRLSSPSISNASGLVSENTPRARLRRALGGYSPLLRWYRRWRPRWLWERTSPLGRVTARFVAEHGLTVRHGLFAGMQYPWDAVDKVWFLPAKLLGCYEQEVIGEISGATFDGFVDLGSGDGFFCVGVKMIRSGVTVIGYETDAYQHRAAQSIAEANDVRFSVCGMATADNLVLPDGRLLVLCDIEGGEVELMDPDLVPRLREASLIIETHARIRPEVFDVLTQRFRCSHDIRKIVGQPRSPSDYPELSGWDAEAANIAVSEGRGEYGSWLVMHPKRPGSVS